MALQRKKRIEPKRARQRQFYRGRNTLNLESSAKLKKQKEYRRKNLSRQRRDAMLLQIRRWGRVALGLAVVVWLVFQMRISGVQFTTTEATLSTAQISELSAFSDEYLKGSGLQRFRPLFNVTELENALEAEFGYVSAASIEKSTFGSVLAATITPAIPLYSFTSNTPNGQYAISNLGTVLQSDDTTTTVSVIDSTDVTYNLGDAVLSSDQIAYLIAAERILAEQSITLTSVELGSDPRELTLKIAGEPYSIRVSTIHPVTVLSTDLPEATALIDSGRVAVSSYIDLRVIDKIFYR